MITVSGLITIREHEEILAAKDAEIERLKKELRHYDQINEANVRTIKEANALLGRAADAIAGWSQNDGVAQPLIAELKKAAQ